jgi:hypothetical protein
MSDDINYQERMKEYQLENETLRAEVMVWRNQFKGLERFRESHWTINVRKPNLGDPSSVLAKMLTMDMDELQRLYIVICLACIVLPTVVEVMVKLGEFKRGYR